MSNSNVQQKIRLLDEAVTPDVKPSLLVTAQLWNIDLSANEAADLLENVCVVLGQIIVSAGAQRSAWTLHSMIALLAHGLIAKRPILLLFPAKPRSARMVHP